MYKQKAMKLIRLQVNSNTHIRTLVILYRPFDIDFLCIWPSWDHPDCQLCISFLITGQSVHAHILQPAVYPMSSNWLSIGLNQLPERIQQVTDWVYSSPLGLFVNIFPFLKWVRDKHGQLNQIFLKQKQPPTKTLRVWGDLHYRGRI